MAQINYSSAQMDQINTLKSQIEDYCQTKGIDSKSYTSYLDNKTTLDPAILNDPVFQAYWQMTYLQLMEIVNPSQVQSLTSEVGEVNFETLYAHTDQTTRDFMFNLVSDDPELMAFVASQNGNPDMPPEKILQLINKNMAPSTEDDLAYVDTQAREIQERLGLGATYDYLINTEEGLKTTENHLMVALSDMDSSLNQLGEALKSHTMSAQEVEATKMKFEQVSANKNLLLAYIQKIEDALQKMMELYSTMVKAQNDLSSSLVRNWKS